MTLDKLKVRTEELKHFFEKVVRQMESQASGKQCVKRMFSEAVMCLSGERRVKTLVEERA